MAANKGRKYVVVLIIGLYFGTILLPRAGTIDNRENSEPILCDGYIGKEFVPGELIVKLKKDTTLLKSSIATSNEKYQICTYKEIFKNAEGTILDNIYLVRVPIKYDILSIAQEYTLCSDVVYAEPNQIVYLCGIPNDTNFSIQWASHNTGQIILDNLSGNPDVDIDAPEAWDIETGSPDVIVAILDTGIDYSHPDLAANIWNNVDETAGNGIDDDTNGFIDDVRGWDFTNDDNDPKDDLGHGTMCAGVAAAVANNHIGIAGICWNCTIMPVKIGSTWNVSVVDIAEGITYASDNGASICSMSFGTVWSYLLRDAVEYAYGKGVFLCAAAGNANVSAKGYPAGFDHVVAVAATNQNDRRCMKEDWGGGGSEYGDWVDIAAPGSLIYSTMPTYHVDFNDFINYYTGQNFSQGYDWFSGTSSATPAVAGVAALLLSKDQLLSPDEVESLLCGNVDPYNSTEYIGTGRLNAQKALAALISDIKFRINGGVGVEMVITNEGTSDVSCVDWQIQVQGGILGLINKTASGTVDIPAGESVSVHSGMLFGLGNIMISAKAEGIGKAVKGGQLLFYTMVK